MTFRDVTDEINLPTLVGSITQIGLIVQEVGLVLSVFLQRPQKIFIGFVATIIRSRIYTLLKEETTRMDKKQNYMTVPAAIRELEKIEMLRGADNEYCLEYAVTATQKAILKAFDVTAESVHRQARAISSDLVRIEMEAMKPNENGLMRRL